MQKVSYSSSWLHCPLSSWHHAKPLFCCLVYPVLPTTAFAFQTPRDPTHCLRALRYTCVPGNVVLCVSALMSKWFCVLHLVLLSTFLTWHYVLRASCLVASICHVQMPQLTLLLPWVPREPTYFSNWALNIVCTGKNKIHLPTPPSASQALQGQGIKMYSRFH